DLHELGEPNLAAPLTGSVTVNSFTGQSQTAILRDVAPAAGFAIRSDAPHLFFTAAGSLTELRRALEKQVTSSSGPVRIAITAANQAQMELKVTAAIRMIDEGKRVSLPGVHFGKHAVSGEVAFLYPGTGAAYPGMTEALAVAYPEVTASLRTRPGMERVSAFYADASESDPRLIGAAAMAFAAMLGTRVVRDYLG
ncbi:MAG: hypothetical protein GY953_56650, partial [bacterium]|nr:hypothetical protein [bacterium]